MARAARGGLEQSRGYLRAQLRALYRPMMIFISHIDWGGYRTPPFSLVWSQAVGILERYERPGRLRWSIALCVQKPMFDEAIPSKVVHLAVSRLSRKYKCVHIDAVVPSRIANSRHLSIKYLVEVLKHSVIVAETTLAARKINGFDVRRAERSVTRVEKQLPKLPSTRPKAPADERIDH